MSRLSRLLPLSAAAGAAAVMGLTALPAQATPVPGPLVVAHPNNVMVGTTTHLTGVGFAPATTLVVKECSVRSWIVNQNPCADNAVTVHVTAAGTFRHAMVAAFCPSVTVGPPPGVVERCYVGVPRPSGVDTITLVGATQLTVTGP